MSVSLPAMDKRLCCHTRIQAVIQSNKGMNEVPSFLEVMRGRPKYFPNTQAIYTTLCVT